MRKQKLSLKSYFIFSFYQLAGFLFVFLSLSLAPKAAQASESQPSQCRRLDKANLLNTCSDVYVHAVHCCINGSANHAVSCTRNARSFGCIDKKTEKNAIVMLLAHQKKLSDNTVRNIGLNDEGQGIAGLCENAKSQFGNGSTYTAGMGGYCKHFLKKCSQGCTGSLQQRCQQELGVLDDKLEASRKAYADFSKQADSCSQATVTAKLKESAKLREPEKLKEPAVETASSADTAGSITSKPSASTSSGSQFWEGSGKALAQTAVALLPVALPLLMSHFNSSDPVSVTPPPDPCADGACLPPPIPDPGVDSEITGTDSSVTLGSAANFSSSTAQEALDLTALDGGQSYVPTAVDPTTNRRVGGLTSGGGGGAPHSTGGMGGELGPAGAPAVDRGFNANVIHGLQGASGGASVKLNTKTAVGGGGFSGYARGSSSESSQDGFSLRSFLPGQPNHKSQHRGLASTRQVDRRFHRLIFENISSAVGGLCKAHKANCNAHEIKRHRRLSL